MESQNSNVKKCGGSQICEHNRVRTTCKECGGASTYIHKKLENQCPDCDGSSICKSRKEPYNTGCRQRGNRKYNGICTHCFANLFPDNPKTETIKKKSKELQVVNSNIYFAPFRSINYLTVLALPQKC